MRRFSSTYTFVSFLVSLAAGLATVTTAIAQSPASPSYSDQVRQNWGNLPLAFEANRGQTDSSIDYLSRGPGYVAFLNSSGATLSLHPQNSATTEALRLTLLGTARNVSGLAEQQLTGKVNYLIGNDPAQWKAGIPQYSRVRYSDVYQGIDLVYYGNPGQLEYDFVVQPGADLRQIAFQLDGAQALRVADNGDLKVQLPDGEIAWKRPEVYQLRDGKRQRVPAEYQIAARTVRFEVGEYDHTRPLVIDPSLSFGTYIGTADGSVPYAIAVDSSQNVYITGMARTSQYPTTSGAYQTSFNGQVDVFITKLSPDGSTLLYSTYVGASGSDAQGYGTAIAVDGSGNAYVGGVTNSSNFPVTAGALHHFSSGAWNGFLLKLNATGSDLIYSAEIGNTTVPGVAIGSAGDVYATGTMFGDGTEITFETTPGAYKTTAGPDCTYDSYVLELNPSGSAPVYSTYVAECEEGTSVAVQNGEAYITGITGQYHPVTAGVVQSTYGGNYDGFVTKLNTTGSALVYSTYLGGGEEDQGNGIAVDSSGDAVVTGITASTNFPLFNPFEFGPVGAFVTKLNSTGTAFVYSTFLGGSKGAEASAVAVDLGGNAYVTGQTYSNDFPTQDAFEGLCGGSTQLSCGPTNFVSKFSSSGALVSSTYYGPPQGDAGANAIAVDASGNAYITGTSPSNLPTTPNAYETTVGGNPQLSSVFAAKINMSGTTGCTLTHQDRTVAICSPFTNTTYGNLVEVSAFVNDISHQVTAIQIYVDGVLKLEDDTPSVSLSGFAIDSYVQVPSGTHRITVKAWDNVSSFEAVRYVTVSGTSASTCVVGYVAPYVQICSPLANSTVSSPVDVSALATNLRPITAMRLYVDNVSYYTVDNSTTLNTSVTLSAGIHRLTVEAWDDEDETWKQVVYVTVQ